MYLRTCRGHGEYFRSDGIHEGRDPERRRRPDRETLSYIKTKSGVNYFEDSEGEPWRCYNFIPDSECYQMAENPEQLYQAGSSFGHFLKQLIDYPASSLKETIPDFHHTAKRFEHLKWPWIEI